MTSIQKFKNCHKGQRVFIIGNGPSLRNVDLDLLNGDYSIAMNRIAAIYDKTSWRPSYFVCTTSNIKDEAWRADILASVDLGVPSFVWNKLSVFFSDSNNCLPISCRNGHEVTHNPPLAWWSDDIESHVTKFGTSMIVAFQIAVYMGFKEIYLLGADLGFKDSLLQKVFYRLRLPKIGHFFDKNHFFKSYGTPGFSAEILNQNMLAAHQLIKSACDAREISVFNATTGGALDVYPRTDFSALMRK